MIEEKKRASIPDLFSFFPFSFDGCISSSIYVQVSFLGV